MNILLVEDNKQTTLYFSKALKEWGHQVKTVETGKEALESAALEIFDLILLNVVLPDVEGYELIPKFKEIRAGTNIIAMTSYNTRELETKVRKQGVLYYMIKPFEMKYLQSITDHLSDKA
ncbi:MAG: response regulator [Desulfobacterales bacterium]|nr:response regulator [Desulfobacterales bacterium]